MITEENLKAAIAKIEAKSANILEALEDADYASAEFFELGRAADELEFALATIRSLLPEGGAS